MSSSTNSSIITTALKTFQGNEEQKHAVSHLLSEITQVSVEDQEKIVQRWNTLDSKRWRSLSALSFFLGVVFLSGAILWKFLPDVHTIGRSLRKEYLAFTLTSFEQLTPKTPQGVFTEKQRLLLNLGGNKSDLIDTTKELWDLDPSNPAYFAHFCRAHVSIHGNLPPNFLEIAEKIDPENSWFLYYAASISTKEGLKQIPTKTTQKNPKRHKQWSVINEDKVSEAITLLHTARPLQKYTDYTEDIRREQAALLQLDDFTEHLNVEQIFLNATPQALAATFRSGDLIGYQANLLAEKEDHAAFDSLVTDVKELLRKQILYSPVTDMEMLLTLVNFIIIESNLRTPSEQLGRTQQIATLQKAAKMCEEARKRTKVPKFEGGDIYAQSDILSGIYLKALTRYSLEPFPLKAALLNPRKILEYEVLAIFSTLAISGIFTVTLPLLFLFRFRQKHSTQILSKRIAQLLQPSDWGWIITCGVVAPLLTTIGLSRSGALGGRDYSAMHWDFLLPAWHYLGLLLLLIIVPVLMIRWRLSKRARAFGYDSSKPFLGWLAVASILISQVSFGFFFQENSEYGIRLGNHPLAQIYDYWDLTGLTEKGIHVHQASIITMLFPLLWIIGALLSSILADPISILKSATVVNTLKPVYLVSTGALIVWLGTLCLLSQRAFKQDELMRYNPSHPLASSYTYRTALLQRATLLEVMEFESSGARHDEKN